MKKITRLTSLMLFSFVLSGCKANNTVTVTPITSDTTTSSNTDTTTEPKRFDGITFSDKTFDYDGQLHYIYCDNVPDFARVSYQGNGRVQVGEYTVTATIFAPDYVSLTLTATLKIIDTTIPFENLIFESLTIDYDGEYHSLEVKNAPEGSNITYTNNNQKSVGVYNVSATVSKTGYKTTTLNATLTIKGQVIEGVVFNDQTIKYDGQYHSIEVENLPVGATVKYTNNNQKAIGTYVVTATIELEGYEKLVLTAKLIITDKKIFPDYEFDNYTYIYDGQNYDVAGIFENYEDYLTRNYTRYYSVTYKINGVAATQTTIKNIGDYVVTATYSEPNYYVDRTFAVNISIINSPGGVDASKEAYQITNNLKFDELYNEIKKGNYSVKGEYFDEYDYNHDGVFEKVTAGLTEDFFVTENAYHKHYRSESEYEDEYYNNCNDYGYLTYQTYYHDVEKSKIPASDFKENAIMKSSGMAPFALLKKSEDGGFADDKVGGYHDSYGSFEIDIENNAFIVYSRTKYFHTEFDHNELMKYTFYNIGNTKLELPNQVKGSDAKNSEYNLHKFYRDGIEYSFYEDKFQADVSLNEYSDAYLQAGTYILEAEIDGYPISSLYKDYYASSYYTKTENYTLKVYFDRYGDYQGEYAQYGYVNSYKNISYFADNILYYSDWH